MEIGPQPAEMPLKVFLCFVLFVREAFYADPDFWQTEARNEEGQGLW
jgi:hypothetical protein